MYFPNGNPIEICVYISISKNACLYIYIYIVFVWINLFLESEHRISNLEK